MERRVLINKKNAVIRVLFFLFSEIICVFVFLGIGGVGVIKEKKRWNRKDYLYMCIEKRRKIIKKV